MLLPQWWQSISLSNHQNHLLSNLPAAELAVLERDLEPVVFVVRQELVSQDTPIEHVFFVETGLGMEIAVAKGEDQIEVGIIGREGLVGLPVVLGRRHSPHRTFTQVNGYGWRLPADKLVLAMDASQVLRTAMYGYAQDFMLQLAETAVANGKFKISSRLARWLLMVRDRLDGDEMPMTQDFLSLMLGVRRASVTVALAALDAEGAIRTGNRRILVRDRVRLEEIAGASYRRPQSSKSEALLT